MLKEWFWLFKKIKSDQHFAEYQPALQRLLDTGQDLHEPDANGRTALGYIFAKPFPSTAAVAWLLNLPQFTVNKEAYLYPYDIDLPAGCFQLTKANNMMDKLDELMPSVWCDTSELAEKQRLAEPYLMLLAKLEAAELTNPFQSNCQYYRQAFADKQQELQQLALLEAQFNQLNVGFHMLAAEYDNPFQSRITGAPWLPSATPDIDSVNLKQLELIQSEPSLKFVCQINFSELNNADPDLLNHRLPTAGLLQVYMPQPEDDEEPQGQCQAIYWSNAELQALDWQEATDKVMIGDMFAPSNFGIECRKAGVYPLCWRPYKQLPDDPEQIALALEKIGTVIDPELYTNCDYDSGLMPQVSERTQLVFNQDGSCIEQPYLPAEHIAILSYLYCDYGSCIFSIPNKALHADNSDWQQLRYIFCQD